MCSALRLSRGVGTAMWRVLRGVDVSGAGPGRASVGEAAPELNRFDEGPCEPDHLWDGGEPCTR